MAKVSVLTRDFDDSLSNRSDPIVYLPKIAAPSTTVVKRALCTDFSSDLLPRFGNERVMTQAIQEVQGEFGPNGERVFKPINDVHDAVRFVGSWTQVNNLVYGPHIESLVSGDYIEITFYGTGLNLLCGDNNMDIRATLDGGTEGSIFFVNNANIMGARGYSSNMVMSVFWAGGVSSTTLGLHTIKIRLGSTNDVLIYGYEVLNANSTIQQTKGTSYLGGKRLYASALTTSSPTSGFTNTYGTAGVRGGHVLVYQKSDGTIAKDIRYTNTAQANSTSADHSNEEVIRTYHWREFSAGRTDDFGSLTTASNASAAFTLDDGTTTLIGANAGMLTGELLAFAATTGFWTFTFVGTGLDIVRQDSGTGSAVHNVTIDAVAASDLASAGSTSKRIEKIVSGLPYGTHTVKIAKPGATSYALGLAQFIVYGPSKPSLPSGCVELADYYIMADYVANATAGDTTIGRGSLRKQNIREVTYVNGSTGTTDWTIPAVQINNCISGFTAYTDRLDAYAEYIFTGTGFDFRFLAASNRSSNIQMSLQSLSTGGSLQNLTTTNFATMTSSYYGTGVVFTPSTGVLDMLDASSTEGGVSISTLPFGTYKIRIQNKTASAFFICDAFDIVTPIHSPKSNLPGDIQNTSSVGSCAIGDSRKFSSTSVKTLANWAQAVGIFSGPTTSSTTAFVPLTDMSVTIKTSGNPVQISYSAIITNNTVGQTADLAVSINGVLFIPSYTESMPSTSGYRQTCSTSFIYPLAAGVHKIDVYWSVSGGTATAPGALRQLTVGEL